LGGSLQADGRTSLHVDHNAALEFVACVLDDQEQAVRHRDRRVLKLPDLLDHLAALVAPLRINRHRNFGVLARTAAHRKFPR
jgi:hypothetical protein